MPSVVEAISDDDIFGDDRFEFSLGPVRYVTGEQNRLNACGNWFTVEVILPPSRLPVKLLTLLKALPITTPSGSRTCHLNRPVYLRKPSMLEDSTSRSFDVKLSAAVLRVAILGTVNSIS